MLKAYTKTPLVSYQEDDGGEEKGNDRRLRRARQQTLQLLGIFALIFVLITVADRRRNRQEVMKAYQRQYGESMKKTILQHNKRLNERNKGNGDRRKEHRIIDDDGDDHKKDDDTRKKYLWKDNPKNESPSGHYRWPDRKLLPPVPGRDNDPDLLEETFRKARKNLQRMERNREYKLNFRVEYGYDKRMEWETAAANLPREERNRGPAVDFTTWEYSYPAPLDAPPPEGYPPVEPLGTILSRWPQDQIDDVPKPFVERLMHFDYSDPAQRDAAIKFRDAEIPFKVYNVPELSAATKKWTDEYVSDEFWKTLEERNEGFRGKKPLANGHCQESDNNYFAFFNQRNWDFLTMGKPPTLDTDWSFEKWAKHARYADDVRLPPHAKHYYWQAGVPREERQAPERKWAFISRDLPSFSSPDPTFFAWKPAEGKGIQCRFGERGVTAATHYDAGRNMVAMITGAKRYILAPPRECPKLGLVTQRNHPEFRHSMLNFGHFDLLGSDSPDAKAMPAEEKAWLEIAKDSLAIDTVLKAGEVLYIPSHWFHYITSLQKSAQCNTRSGRSKHHSDEFGGRVDVEECMGEE